MSDKFVLTNGMDINKKFKAIYPHIVVGGDITNPYYTIHWYDPDTKQVVVGFGSSNLKFVYDWLQNSFDVINPSPDYLIDELSKKENDLFYKLAGVMHSVDKWLDGEELNQDEVNRAATMREKTLKIVEDLQLEKERLEKVQVQYVRAYFEEFITRLLRDCQMTTLDTTLIGEICKDLMEAMEVDFANLADFTHLIEVRAYEEFAEKLKEIAISRYDAFDEQEYPSVKLTDLDNLLKEKVDKKNVD